MIPQVVDTKVSGPAYVPRGPQGVHSSSSEFLKARHSKQPDIGMKAFGKVLLSNSAIKDFGNELAELLDASSMVIDDRGFGMKYELPHHLRPKWEHLTTAFLQSVIIHEHAHAIFAEGIGEHGRASLADMDKDGWKAAKRLNESLAEWAELHFFREDAEMLDIAWEHATSGQYPQWPYQGALVVEKIYQEREKRGGRGVEAVRELIREMRRNPKKAQEDFEKRLQDILVARRDPVAGDAP